MVSIELTSDSLCIHIHGWARVQSLRSSLTVPLSHVIRARVRPPEANFDDAIFESWRGVGTYAPGRFATGTVMLRDGRSFFDVREHGRTIAIDLAGERYRHIVVDLRDETPEEAVERIERAIHPGAPEAASAS